MTRSLDEPRTFVRVYRLPKKLTDGYCFGGSVAIAFFNVDWFEAPVDGGRAMLEPFVRGKAYFDPQARFLVLSDEPTLTFTIDPVKD